MEAIIDTAEVRRWKRYESSKTTAVDAFGDVPDHWGIVRLKRRARISYGLGQPPEQMSNGLPLIRATNVNRGKIVEEGLVYVNPDDVPPSRDAVLQTDDIIVVRSGAYTGDSAIVPRKYSGAIAGYDMFARCELDHAPYIAWQLLSREILKYQFEPLMTRAAQPHLNASELGNCALCLPPLEEQRAIAAFLDRETERIDALIGHKERLIALLEEKRQAVISHAVTRGLEPNAKMKDTGIPCIGDVPDHWSVGRNKVILREVDCRSSTGDEELLTVSHITGVTRRSEKSEVTMFLAESNEGYKVCEPGDFIINTMWAFMGAVGIAFEKGCVSPSYNVYRPVDHDSIIPKYFDLLYRTESFKTEMLRGSKGIWHSRLRLYPDVFLNMRTPLPPRDEQEQILEYIEHYSSKANALSAALTTSIERLQEYRTALISAAVTGQIDVREEVSI